MTEVWELYESIPPYGTGFGWQATERRVGFYSTQAKAKKARLKQTNRGAFHIRMHRVDE